MAAGGAQTGDAPVGQPLQTPVEFRPVRLGDYDMAEQRKWPEADGPVSHLEQAGTREHLIDEAAPMEGRLGHGRAPMQPQATEDHLQALTERDERQVVAWV